MQAQGIRASARVHDWRVQPVRAMPGDHSEDHIGGAMSEFKSQCDQHFALEFGLEVETTLDIEPIVLDTSDSFFCTTCETLLDSAEATGQCATCVVEDAHAHEIAELCTPEGYDLSATIPRSRQERSAERGAYNSAFFYSYSFAGFAGVAL